MAKIFTDDEILELAKEKGIDLTENDVRERNTLGADNDVIDYEEQLKSLGKKEGYDYLQDFKEVKESLLANTYSPRTKKVYSYEEAQNMTAKDYYNDVMDAANHLDNDNGALKTFAWGLLERTGGSALVKGIAGEERVKDIQNQVENVYGNNGIARTLGRITGDVWAFGTAGMAGSAISGAAGGSAALGSILGQTAAGGLTGGAEAYTYSNDPVDVAAGVAKGSAYGLARGVVSNALKTSLMNANPEILKRATEIANPNIVTTGKDVALNVAQNFGVNALSQGAGAYAGTAASGTAGNLINAIGGKEVSAKDWTKPFWSTETLLATGLSALIGGTLETVNDRMQISNFVKKDIDAINAQAQKNAIGMEQALKNGDTASATAFAKAETDAINSYLGKTYAGASFNDSFKQQMMNDWTNYVADQFKKYGIPFDIPKQIGTGAANMNITPDFGNTPPPGSDLTPTNRALAPNITNSTTQNVDGNLPQRYNVSNGGGVSAALGGNKNYLGNQREVLGEDGGENRLPSGVQGAPTGDLYGGKSEEIVSQILQDDKDGFYGESGNEELNKSFQASAKAQIQKTAEVLKDKPPIVIADRKFTTDFIDKGYTDLNGKKIESYKDLADISQIFRNPKYETFRVIYMQGDTIVGQEAISSKLPNQTEFYPSNGMEDPNIIRELGTEGMSDRMKRLGADGYYLVHNHPSGDAYIGLGDRNETLQLIDQVEGFKGHIVVDSGTYALMIPDSSNVDGYSIHDYQKIENYKPDEIDKMMSTKPWFQEKATIDSLINIAYSLKNDPEYSMVTITDASDVPRIMLDVKNTFFNTNYREVNNWLKNVARENGGVYAYLTTNDSNLYEKINSKKSGRLYGFNDTVLYGINQNGELVAKSFNTNPKKGMHEITANLNKAKSPKASVRIYDDKNISRLEKATDNLRNELVKKDEKIKATEMNAKRTERAKLNKKLDTAKDKLAQTRYDNKEKIKATKEEGKEKIHKLVAKKNQGKYEAVKETKKQSNEKINKLKNQNIEKVKDAKQSARATTTDKKMKLAMTRLDNALNKAYDKPESKELDEALNAVKKFSRSSIKLINNVKNKLPSSYDSFADDVLDIVDTYYTGGNAMTPEKRASLERKAKAIQDFAKEHPEYPISKRALDLLKEPSKKNIADLNPRDLVSLAEDLQEIGTAVRDMFSFTRASEDAVKLREEAMKFAKDRLKRGEGRNYNNISSKKSLDTITELSQNYIDKRSTIETLTTALSGGDPNSPFNFIPDQLKQAYDRYNRAYEKMLRLFDKYVDVKKVGNIRYYNNKLNEVFDPKKTIDVKLKAVGGEEYSPTIRDAVSVLLGVKDPQFAGHSIGVITEKVKDGKPLLSEGGNVVFANNLDEKYGRVEKGLKRGVKVKLEAGDIKKIEEALSKYPIVKELMDTFKELTDLTYELTNEAHEAINGMSLEKRDYYFPIKNDPATRPRQSLSDKLNGFNGQDASTTLQNSSFVKPVVEGANGQILIYPIDSVINKLIENAALYNGYSTALYDINSFLSARTDENETLVELINHLDPSYLTNYGKITNAIVGNVKPGSKMGTSLAGNFTKGILNANFWLALKQAGSYFTAAPFFDRPMRSLMAGLFKRGDMAKIIKDYYKEQGIDISKLNNSETLKYFWDDKVNAELSTRARGYTTADKGLILKHTGILERIKALDWYKSVDIGTINALAWAMFYDVYTNPETNIETDAFFNDLGSRYISANIATQPNSAAITRAPIQVDGNILDRALSFMADPRIKNVNTLANARMRYKYSKKHGDKEQQQKYGSAYAKIAVGTLASLAYITTVSRLKQDAEGKKKETSFWQDMVGNVFGLTIGMEQIVGKFLNDYSFDVSLPDTQAFNLLLNFGEDAKNIFNKENKEKYIEKALQDMSGFLGIPYKNLKNDYNALTNLFDKSTFYKNKIKADSNMYKKYEKFEDDIYDYEEFYKLYNATRQKAVEEEYGKYNNENIKRAIRDNDGDLSTYFKMFKKN